MIFAQFFQMSTGYVEGSIPPRFDEAHKRPIEACGDRGVLVIDGRLSPETIGDIARKEGAKRGYVAYRIFRGDTFTRSSPISGIWPIPSKVDNSVSAATWGN